MSRRHAATTGCALAVTALTLVAALACRRTSDSRPRTAVPPAAPPTQQPPPPGVLEALQRDLGLTREQALARLRNEARLAPVEAELRDRLGDRFGGSWFMGKISQTLVVATTSAADIPQIAAAGARPRIVPRSLAQLTLIKQKLDKVLATHPYGGSVRYVDVKIDKVVILSATPTETRKLVETLDVDMTAVTVVFSKERPRPDDVRPPYSVSATAYCSSGSVATREAQNGSTVTGHCGRPGTGSGGAAPGRPRRVTGHRALGLPSPGAQPYGQTQSGQQEPQHYRHNRQTRERQRGHGRPRARAHVPRRAPRGVTSPAARGAT